MKKILLSLMFLCSLFFCGCRVDYEDIIIAALVPTVLNVSYEMGGTKIDESEYFQGGKKTSDWLMIMYMDADNSLYSEIRSDFNEVEKGLAIIRNSSGYDSVRVVVLWDGSSLNDTGIFELGADSENGSYAGELTYDIQNFNNFTDFQGNVVDMSLFNGKEVNMAQGETLTTFLKWVDSHYTATKKILHVADHGTGPGNLTRAICEDSTSKTAPMSSSEFSSALYKAGYGSGRNKYSALLFDVCLGASIEDAYQFRNYADYMIASPNSTPGSGFNYVDVLQCFKTGDNAMAVSKSIGKSFSSNYKNASGATVTVIDLSKVDDCASKIDALTVSLKSNKDTYKKYLMYDGTITNNLWYRGSINWLFDIGYFALKIQSDASSGEDIVDNANQLEGNLKSCIVYSWRNSMYDYENQPTCLGITICGGMNDGRSGATYGIPSWYKTDIDFGKRSNGWADMIENWFGKGFRVSN